MKQHKDIGSKDRDNDQDPQAPKRMSRAQKVGVTAALLAAGSAIGGDLYYTAHQIHEQPGAAQTANEQLVEYRKALEDELRSVYVGPVAIASAEKADGVYVDPVMRQKRGIINLHIGGTAINEKTYKSTGDPDYILSKEPVVDVHLPNGETVSGDARWTSAEGNGEAALYPVLANFARSTPKTLDYQLELTAGGWMPTGQEVDALYDAGEVAVTGSNNEITSVTVVPRPKNVPAIQIVDPKPGMTYLHL
jgi:hypothetical protein